MPARTSRKTILHKKYKSFEQSKLYKALDYEEKAKVCDFSRFPDVLLNVLNKTALV